MKSRRNSDRSITLLELIVSIITVSAMIVTIYGIYTYTYSQVLNSERRTKVQNELAYAFEHMTKYVQQANGNTSNPPVKAYPAVGTQTGFQARVDFNNPQTVSNLADDAWVSYYLTGNTLYAACTGTGCPFTTDTLSDKIIANFVVGIMPNNPTNGYYVNIDTLGNLVEIGLVGRYKPTEAYSVATRTLNPQVEMKTRIVCNNASTH